jgi:hypothetical protein
LLLGHGLIGERLGVPRDAVEPARVKVEDALGSPSALAQ